MSKRSWQRSIISCGNLAVVQLALQAKVLGGWREWGRDGVFQGEGLAEVVGGEGGVPPLAAHSVAKLSSGLGVSLLH